MNSARNLAGRVFLAVVAMLFLSIGGGHAFAETVNLDKLDTQIKAPSVQIIMADQGGYCSGTIVASKRDDKTGEVKTVILTAEHCVKDNPYRDQTVSMPNWGDDGSVVSRNDYVATVEKQGTDTNDLALLVLKDKQHIFNDRLAKVEKADAKIRFGEQVFTSGYALGRDLGVTEGRFNDREDYNFPDEGNETSYFRASPAIAGGNSGGGLFHVTATGDFALIGVADWKVGKEPGTFGAYTPIDRVYKFLSDYDSKTWEPKKDK